jgi:hypothetical protein
VPGATLSQFTQTSSAAGEMIPIPNHRCSCGADLPVGFRFVRGAVRSDAVAVAVAVFRCR